MNTFLRFLFGGIISASLTVLIAFSLAHGMSLLALPTALHTLLNLVFVIGTPPLAIIIGLLGGVQASKDAKGACHSSNHYFVG